jgi:uncharacterized protein with HEPN domain
MQPEDRNISYLWDMRDYASQVATLMVSARFDDFAPGSVLRLAVERGIEVIGEAAKRVAPIFQDEHPEFPWRRMIGQRNVLAHEYGEIDVRQLWQTANEDMLPLIAAIDAILPRRETTG